MEVIILAGGEGTRLRPLTERTPKPLLPLLDEPAVGYTLQLLRRHGMTCARLAVCHGAKAIRDALDDGSRYGMTLSYAEEKTPLGTAGSVRGAAGDGETLLVMSSDVLTDADLSDMIACHRASGALATMALTAVEDARPYGLCSVDEQGRVLQLQEKPCGATPIPGVVNAGIYLLEPEVLQRISMGARCDFARDILPQLAREGRLQGWHLRGYWCDIGSPACYARAQDDLLQGHVGLAVRGRRAGRMLLGTGAQVDARARITGRCYVGENVRVGPGAVIGAGTVLCRGAFVGSGAQVDHACLWSGVRVEKNALVRETVLLPGGGIAPYPKAAEDAVAKYPIKKEG